VTWRDRAPSSRPAGAAEGRSSRGPALRRSRGPTRGAAGRSSTTSTRRRSAGRRPDEKGPTP